MSEYVECGGIEWCVEHNGVADECSQDGTRCDMAEDGDCVLVDVYYRKPERGGTRNGYRGGWSPGEQRLAGPVVPL